jgi:hypothetical protein
MSRLRLLQVCNVGRIVGGTAACAWTVARALPEFEHVVAFLSDIAFETREAFSEIRIEQWPQCTGRVMDAVGADVVLLHNIGGRERMSTSAVMLQYVHSAGTRAPADVTVYCSQWLAARCGGLSNDVLYQGVPQPPRRAESRATERGRDGRLIVGRICTPIARKWPRSIIDFYTILARRCPEVEWEFVGCPNGLESELRDACDGRARFFPAGWEARSRLWEWDALLYHNPDVTESFGRIVAESLRAGCIPVVDGRGGFVEQVTPATGFLCGTVEEFADSIDRLRETGLRASMSAAGRIDADRRFSIARFREQLLKRIRAAANT